MNIELAIRILVNNGFIVNTDENIVVVEHPRRSVKIAEITNLLNPFDARFVTFYRVYDRVQIFFD
jgi:hypothetical protein